MKEILFNFDEFRNRISTRSKVHASYESQNFQAYSRYIFRLSFMEYPNHIVVFEKSSLLSFLENDEFKAFRDECRSLAEKVGATPGYYEDEVDA